MFNEKSIKEEAVTFEKVISTLFFPVGRQVSTVVERLPKGRFVIKTEVTFSHLDNVSNLITLEFKRDKKDRQAYQIDAVVLYRRVDGKTDTFRFATDEDYVPLLVEVIDTHGICTHLLKEIKE